jgi:hypothetical protein
VQEHHTRSAHHFITPASQFFKVEPGNVIEVEADRRRDCGDAPECVSQFFFQSRSVQLAALKLVLADMGETSPASSAIPEAASINCRSRDRDSFVIALAACWYSLSVTTQSPACSSGFRKTLKHRGAQRRTEASHVTEGRDD